jgi:hypothetical protein
MCYTWFGAYPNHKHITIIVKNNLLKKRKMGGKGKLGEKGKWGGGEK